MKKFFRELIELDKAIANGNDTGGIIKITKDDNPAICIATIKGPEESPYEKGLFDLRVEVSSSYPFQPPKITFQTKVWHPNVSSVTGYICLDILKNNWTPSLTISQVIVSIRSLMTDPNPDSPQDHQVASQYLNDRPLWRKTAAEWTEKYASETQG
eukprot:GAHX01000410.1.p1 GENE.GAHX01000410.1~~GAHX01000410.1.p1  ORF type:complete len:156 (-),score=18.28 GAHX01000410.1:33-500(-)